MKTAQAEPDSRSGNDSGGVTLTAAPSADIAVDKDVDRGSALAGENVLFTVRVDNRGPSPATGVAIADALPAGLALVSATPSLGTYSGGVWTVGNRRLGSGDPDHRRHAHPVRPHVDQASVTAPNQTDPDPLNDAELRQSMPWPTPTSACPRL